MGNLLIILGVLLVALVIVVPLVEKFGHTRSPEQLQKLSRFIFPLIALLIIVQLIAYFFR